MTPDERWLAEAWPFVRAHLPGPPGRILDIGCGSFGGFVPRLRQDGYDARGIDPSAPAGPEYHQVEFAEYESTQPIDAVIASTSLHHIPDLHGALDTIRALLAPDGVVVVAEWAWERMDEATARWCFDRLSPHVQPSFVRARRDSWRESGESWSAYMNAWAAEAGLHSSAAILSALDERFEPTATAHGPYFFADLEATAADERAAIEVCAIRACATYVAGRLRRP